MIAPVDAAGLQFALQGSGEVTTSTSFTFLNGPQPWVFFLLVLPAVIAFSVFMYKKEKAPVPGRTRALLAGLRALLLILLVLFIFRPALLESRVIVEKPSGLVLLDDSASMREHDAYSDSAARARLESAARLESSESVAGLTRRELVERVLSPPAGGVLDDLMERYDLKLYSFGSALAQVSGLSELRAEGESTRLGDALAAAIREHRGRGLSAVVVVSDGRSNRGRDARDAAFSAFSQQTPVYTVGVGDASAPRNVEVTGVNAPTVALVGDEVTFRVNIWSSGYGGRPVMLRLVNRADGSILATRDFELRASGGEQQEQLYWKPELEGDFTLTVEVPRLAGEQDAEDNAQSHVVRVESARIRVLYVEGYPRWEYRFVKNLLLRGENLEVQVFLQSADPDFIQESSGSVPPLAHLPRDLKELMEYHVVIFGDVDPNRLGDTWEESQAFMDALKKFVEAGGGFLMQAGVLHSPSSYAETPIADILPVVIGNYDEQRLLAAGSEGAEEEYFRPKLENYLSPHEILLLEKDPVKNRRLWEDPEFGLPGFYWYYPVERPKPGAEVLARHPRNSNRYGDHVVLAATYYPLGRTVFLGVDSTWRWRFPYLERYTEKFWKGMVRYLAQNKLRRTGYRFELYTDRSLYDINERVHITARVQDEDYRLSREPAQPVSLMEPDGSVEELTLDQVAEGEFERSIVRSEPGIYQIWIEAEENGIEVRHALTSFTVAVPRLESENPVLDRALLGDVARITGGQYLDLAEAGRLDELLKDEARVRRLGEPERHDLWNTWLALLAVVGILAAEWILRKRLNLV